MPKMSLFNTGIC